jgi:hypothetical protein
MATKEGLNMLDGITKRLELTIIVKSEQSLANQVYKIVQNLNHKTWS